MESAGAAILVMTTAFVILELVNGHFQAAAFGHVPIALAVMSMLVGGPVDTMTIAFSILLSNLPRIFNAKDPPKRKPPTPARPSPKILSHY